MGRFISAVANKLNFVSGFAIIIMMLIMSMDVVFRYLLKMAVLDTMEISSLLLGAIVSLALPFVTDQEEHVSFDLLTDRLSPGPKCCQVYHLIDFCALIYLVDLADDLSSHLQFQKRRVHRHHGDPSLARKISIRFWVPVDLVGFGGSIYGLFRVKTP